MKLANISPIITTLFLFALLVLTLTLQVTQAAATKSNLRGVLMFPTHNGGQFPLRNSYFEVWKKCGPFDMLNCNVTKGTTNLDGTFSVGIEGGADCTCWVTAYTTIPNVVNVRCPERQESSADCQPSSFGQSRNLHYDFQSVHIKDRDSFDYGTNALPASTPIAESARVADTILTGWLLVKNYTGFSIPEVSVEFPCGTFCPKGVYFDPRTMGDIYIQPNLDAQTIVHGYSQFLSWYHTTNLSDEQLSSLLDKSLTQNIRGQEIAL